MSFRIIGGEFRGRSLKSPKTDKTRPTLAIMRKAVFDILQDRIEGASFLDLYAGSGAMGLEALSRGASAATFVETSPQALRCIEENIKTFHVESRAVLLGYDCFAALKKMVSKGVHFDIIYADPPYAAAARLNLLEEILHYLNSHLLLKPGGTLFLEEAAPPALPAQSLSQLHYIDSRTFSRSTLHQFRMAG